MRDYCLKRWVLMRVYKKALFAALLAVFLLLSANQANAACCAYSVTNTCQTFDLGLESCSSPNVLVSNSESCDAFALTSCNQGCCCLEDGGGTTFLQALCPNATTNFHVGISSEVECSAICSGGSQTASLSGQVTNLSNGAAASGVDVSIINYNLHANTDANGNYNINNVPVGTVTVKASLDGCTAQGVIDLFENTQFNLALDCCQRTCTSW